MHPLGHEVQTTRDHLDLARFQHHETIGNFLGQNRVMRG